MKKRLHPLSLHRETLHLLVGGKTGNPGDDMSQIAMSCAATCTNCDQTGGNEHLQSNTTCWC